MFNHMVKLSEFELDAVFRALADSTRRAMTVRLTRGDASMSELAAPFPMSLAAISKHLSVLEEAGIVRGRKQGRSRYFELVPQQLEVASGWVEQQSAFWRKRFDGLHEFLDRPAAK